MHQKTMVRFVQIIVVFLILHMQGSQGGGIPGSSGAAGSVSSGGGGASGHMSSNHGGQTSYSEVEIKPGDIYLDKFTDRLEYNKGEPVTVILRIHAIEPRDGLKFSNENVYLYEELYSTNADNVQQKNYDLVKTIPDHESFKSGELVWHFDNLEKLIKTKEIKN